MQNKHKTLRICLIGLFLLMLILGIAAGEPAVVYKKAVNLCLECIGIG